MAGHSFESPSRAWYDPLTGRELKALVRLAAARYPDEFAAAVRRGADPSVANGVGPRAFRGWFNGPATRLLHRVSPAAAEASVIHDMVKSTGDNREAQMAMERCLRAQGVGRAIAVPVTAATAAWDAVAG